jgi:hypothetical protein
VTAITFQAGENVSAANAAQNPVGSSLAFGARAAVSAEPRLSEVVGHWHLRESRFQPVYAELWNHATAGFQGIPLAKIKISKNKILELSGRRDHSPSRVLETTPRMVCNDH